MPYPAITRAELLYLTVNAPDLAARRSRLNFGPVPWPCTGKQLAGFGGSIRAHAAVTPSSTSRETAPWRTLARAARAVFGACGSEKGRSFRKGRECISGMPSATLQELLILMQGLAPNSNIFRQFNQTQGFKINNVVKSGLNKLSRFPL